MHPNNSSVSLWIQLSCITILMLPLTLALSAPDEKDATTSLEEIIVDENELPVAELPLGTSVSGETLRDATGSSGDPFRGLQTLPGFVFVDDENAEPAVRGARPGDNYFEIDFIPLTYISHADNAVSVFNSDLVETFSIYPSAHGPEYSGVSGGVFDVRLRDPRTDRFHATLDVNFLHAGLLLEGPVKDSHSFYLAGRFSYLDVFVEDQLDNDTDYTQFPEYTDYQGKYVWKVNEESSVRLQALGASDDFEAIVQNSVAVSELPEISSVRDFESTSFHQQGIVWDLNLSSGLLAKSVLAHTESSGASQNGGTTRFDDDDSQWLVKSYLELPLDDKHRLSFGASVLRDKSTSAISFNRLDCPQSMPDSMPDCSNADTVRVTTREKTSTDRAHLFFKDSWFATDRLTLFPGIVLLGENRSDSVFLEPRLAAEYSLREDLVLSAGAGLYHQAAEQIQLSELYGNPDLDHIKSIDLVVGAEKSFSKGWHIKSELYYKKLDKLVRRDATQAYNNSGDGHAYGLDTLIRTSIGEKLSGWLSVSFSQASREDQSNQKNYPFAYDQPYSLSLVGKYQLSNAWDIGAKIWMRSGTPYTPVAGAVADPDNAGRFFPLFGETNSARYPSYQRFDLRLNRVFRHRGERKTTVSLEILNLFDRKNVLSYRYSNDFSQRFAVYQLPRIFGLGIKTQF